MPEQLANLLTRFTPHQIMSAAKEMAATAVTVTAVNPMGNGITRSVTDQSGGMQG